MHGYNADIHHPRSDLAAFSLNNRTNISRSGFEATREEEEEGGTEQERPKYGMPSPGSGRIWQEQRQRWHIVAERNTLEHKWQRGEMTTGEAER